MLPFYNAYLIYFYFISNVSQCKDLADYCYLLCNEEIFRGTEMKKENDT